ncbi:unnamed protein product [Schistocephalus solidus]|uniref:Uncharacterized protein n=1 Tax=Schistocephalus solidus TaxID=70667 RepID=A0A183TIK8_SCHSO|nr:unnamed protein product [Schistocephalus solidus]
MVYDDYDLWEDRMKVYLEAVDKGVHPAAILRRLDNEVFTVARAANLTASLTPETIFGHLWREFGRSLRPWVALATLKSRRQHAGESVVDFQRHLRVLARMIKVALDIGRREEAIYTAYPLVQISSPSAFGCHQAPAAIQDSPVMSSPWDSDRATTSAHKRLNGSGALLSPLLLGEALHSLLDAEPAGNNVVIRPALHLPQVFM